MTSRRSRINPFNCVLKTFSITVDGLIFLLYNMVFNRHELLTNVYE